VVCVWGVVLAGTTKFPDSNLLYGANVVANLLDPNENGKPDNEAIRKSFSAYNGWMLGGSVNADE